MPQMLLPFFPVGVIRITDALAFEQEDGMVTYFNATMPGFHGGAYCFIERDLSSM